jgi:predicted metal-dependent peptidase
MPNQALIADLSKTTISILLEEPYLGHFAMGILKCEGQQLDTLAISRANLIPAISFSTAYWLSDTLSADHKYGLLKHELLHLSLNHHLFAHKYPHKRIYDIAADLVVNQYIEAYKLPDDPITLARFSGFRWRSHQDIAYYYAALMQAMRSAGAGKSKAYLNALLQREDNPWIKKHANWHNQFSKLSNAARRNMLQQVESLLITAASKHKKGASGKKLPAALEAYFPEQQNQQSQMLDWRRMLRIFAASSERTMVRHTIKKPSKRYGTTPGIKIKRRQKIMVAIDTSGSIKPESLGLFFKELFHIWRNGAEVMVVECDFAIRRKYQYRGQAVQYALGRGGTNFSPPIQFANEEYLPDALIYFTDGHAPPPKVVSRSPVLWIISPDGVNMDSERWQALPGRKVKMHVL